MHSDSPFPRPAFLPASFNYDPLRQQPVGLTGARGVLGRLLLRRLQLHGVTVHAYAGDINDEAALAQWFGNHSFGCLLHLAALVPVDRVEANPLAAYQTNVIGTFNVCRQLQQTQRDCWLFQCSTSHVYQPQAGNARLGEDAPLQPQTFYGVTKRAAEYVVRDLLDKLQLPYCIGRVFSYSHSSQREPFLVPTLRRRIEELPERGTLEVMNPAAMRDIQDAEPVVDCILQLALRRAQGIVNIGTGSGLTVRDIALAVARQLGKDISVTGADSGPAGALIADTTNLQRILAT